MTVSHIHEEQAKRARQALLSALGSENNPNQWLAFMDTAKQYLPFLFETGRPTKQQIDESVVGVLGFSSWSEMIESPVPQGGLNWSINTWKQWKKSFNITERFSYLRTLGFSPSYILKLNTVFQGNFPESSEKLEGEKKRLAEAKIKEQDELMASLQSRVRELESQLSEANAVNEQLHKQSASLASVMSDFKVAMEETSALKHQLQIVSAEKVAAAEKAKEAIHAHNELAEKYKQLKNLGFAGRLKRLFVN